jgi:hypothetical protein
VGWPGIPDNMDGATWGGHSIFYFFKGELHTTRAKFLKHLATNWSGLK